MGGGVWVVGAMWDHLGRVLGRGEGLWVLEQDYGSSLAPPPLKAGVGGYRL